MDLAFWSRIIRRVSKSWLLLEDNVERGQTKQQQPPRVEDLHFCLFQRPIHPELFHIYRVKRIEQARYQAEIWITGLAHVVTVHSEGQVLTELISADLELLPKVGLSTSFRFRGERDHMQSFSDDLKYILSTQVEKMTPELFPATHRDYVHFAQDRGLYVPFEEWTYQGITPFTFLDFDARDHEFHVHAFHTFPEEATLLKTQSIFEVGKRTITPVW